MSLFFTESFMSFKVQNVLGPLVNPDEYRYPLSQGGWSSGSSPWNNSCHWWVKEDSVNPNRNVLTRYISNATSDSGVLNFQLPTTDQEIYLGFSIFVPPDYNPAISTVSSFLFKFSLQNQLGVDTGGFELFRITHSLHISKETQTPQSEITLSKSQLSYVECRISKNRYSVWINNQIVHDFNNLPESQNPFNAGTTLAIKAGYDNTYGLSSTNGGFEIGNIYFLVNDSELPTNRLGKDTRVIGNKALIDKTTEWKPTTATEDHYLIAGQELSNQYQITLKSNVSDNVESFQTFVKRDQELANNIHALVVKNTVSTNVPDVKVFQPYLRTETNETNGQYASIAPIYPSVMTEINRGSGVVDVSDNGSVMLMTEGNQVYFGSAPDYQTTELVFDTPSLDVPRIFVSKGGSALAFASNSNGEFFFLPNGSLPDLENWIHLESGLDTTSGLVSVSTNDNDTCLISLNNDLYRSTDEGVTWTKVYDSTLYDADVKQTIISGNQALSIIDKHAINNQTIATVPYKAKSLPVANATPYVNRDGSVLILITNTEAYYSLPPYDTATLVPFDVQSAATAFVSPIGNIVVMQKASPGKYAYLLAGSDPESDWALGQRGTALTACAINDAGDIMIRNNGTLSLMLANTETWISKGSTVDNNTPTSLVIVGDIALTSSTRQNGVQQRQFIQRCGNIKATTLSWSESSVLGLSSSVESRLVLDTVSENVFYSSVVQGELRVLLKSNNYALNGTVIGTVPPSPIREMTVCDNNAIVSVTGNSTDVYFKRNILASGEWTLLKVADLGATGGANGKYALLQNVDFFTQNASGNPSYFYKSTSTKRLFSNIGSGTVTWEDDIPSENLTENLLLDKSNDDIYSLQRNKEIYRLEAPLANANGVMGGTIGRLIDVKSIRGNYIVGTKTGDDYLYVTTNGLVGQLFRNVKPYVISEVSFYSVSQTEEGFIVTADRAMSYYVKNDSVGYAVEKPSSYIHGRLIYNKNPDTDSPWLPEHIGQVSFGVKFIR